MAGNLEQIGVEAVVEGLTGFLGDISQVNGALDSIRPQATLLQQAFGWVGDQLSSFGDMVVHVAEYAIGGLLKDAIEGAISLLADLANSAIQAGENFQLLQIRLNGINLQDALTSTTDYTAAQKIAQAATQDQITWMQKLAVQTPFDATDINQIYFLARSYGFADDAARTLTQDTLDYASGMGLTTDRLQKMTMDLGTMIARGKITGTALRTLTQSSFLPLADILARVAKNMGITTEELKKQISTTEGVPADLFVQAFEQMVQEEPRFKGATTRMNQAFTVSIENMRDIVQNVGGKNIMQPILDALGTGFAALVNTFQSDLNWLQLTKIAQRIGDTVAEIINKVMGLMPSSQGIVDAVLTGLKSFADWLTEHKDDIVAFVQNAAEWIGTVLIPKLMEIGSWFITNWPTIQNFIATIAGIIGELLNRWFGNAGSVGTGLGDGIVKFMQFVIDHKEEIVNFIDTAGKAWLGWEIAMTILGAIVNFIITIVGMALAISGFIALVGAIGSTFVVVLAIILNVILWLGVLAISVLSAAAAFTIIMTAIGWVVNSPLWQSLSDIAANTVNNVQAALRNGDWFGAGVAIVMGIINGFNTMVVVLFDMVANAAQNIVNTINSALSGGINWSGSSSGGMNSQSYAPQSVYAPTSYAAPNTSNSTTYNQNLTIHSSANTEPIISDFGMMSSLAHAVGSAHAA